MFTLPFQRRSKSAPEYIVVVHGGHALPFQRKQRTHEFGLEASESQKLCNVCHATRAGLPFQLEADIAGLLPFQRLRLGMPATVSAQSPAVGVTYSRRREVLPVPATVSA